MKTISLSEVLNQISATVNRFPLTVFSVFGLAIMMLANINQWELRDNSSLWVLFLFSTPATLAASLYSERRMSKLNSTLLTLGVYAIIVFYSLVFIKQDLTDTQGVQHAIIVMMLVLLNFVAAFVNSPDELNIWEFGRKSILQIIISGLFAAVLFAGLSLANLAVELLFQIPNNEKIYGDIAVFSVLGFAPIYFLSQMPSKDQIPELIADFNKVVRFLGLYILLPLVNLYLIILYAYFIKILINWELPVGLVTKPVTILGIGAILTFFVLKPVETNLEFKFFNNFQKLFPYLFLPLLVLMSVGIATRIAEYGITYNRLFVVILNLWFYGLSVYMLVRKSLKIQVVLFSFILLGLLSCIGPWNVFKMDEKFRTEELELQTPVKMETSVPQK